MPRPKSFPSVRRHDPADHLRTDVVRTVAQEPSIWRMSQVPNAKTMYQLGWSQSLSARLKRRSRPESRRRISLPFPTVFPLQKVSDADLTEARKSSSYAKHCIFLIPLAAGNGFKKIPLPAPALLQYLRGLCASVRFCVHSGQIDRREINGELIMFLRKRGTRSKDAELRVAGWRCGRDI